MSNSVDPDETAQYEPSHLDLRCLQKPIIIAYGSKRVTATVSSETVVPYIFGHLYSFTPYFSCKFEPFHL